VVLVGHSYAGAVVVPGVADRVPDRIGKLVFVDSGPLPDGMAQSQFTPPDERARNAELVRTAGQGWQLPPPPWRRLAPHLPEDVLDRLVELSAPQPWATATTPVRLTGAWEELPRLHVLCSFTEEQLREKVGTVPAFAHMAAEGLEFRELPSWHWPMFDHPAELAAILHDAA
jgi:pimeloyl-ACP methyl ester carboxylesterase